MIKYVFSFLNSPGSFKKSVIILFFFQIISKFIQMLRSIIIASYFGFGQISDLYLYASNIFGGIHNIFINALSAGLIPFLSDKKNKDEREKFLQSSLLLLLTFICCLNALIWIGMPQLQSWIAPGFKSLSEHNLLKQFFLLLSFNSIFLVVERMVESDLNSQKIFGPPQWASAVGALCNILFLYAFAQKSPFILAGSTVLGSMVTVALLAYALPFRWRGFDMGAFRLFSFATPLIISGGIGIINMMVDRAFATTLDAGTVSVLSYAYLLVSTASGLSHQIISKASFSYLADLTHQPEVLANQILKLYRIYIGLFILTNFLYLCCGPLVLRFMFLRGTISPADISLLISQFLVYLPLLFVFGVGGILIQGFYSYKESLYPTLITILGILLNIIFNYLWLPYIGIYALSLSTTLIGVSTLFFQLALGLKKFDLPLPENKWFLGALSIYSLNIICFLAEPTWFIHSLLIMVTLALFSIGFKSEALSTWAYVKPFIVSKFRPKH